MTSDLPPVNSLCVTEAEQGKSEWGKGAIHMLKEILSNIYGNMQTSGMTKNIAAQSST